MARTSDGANGVNGANSVEAAILLEMLPPPEEITYADPQDATPGWSRLGNATSELEAQVVELREQLEIEIASCEDPLPVSPWEDPAVRDEGLAHLDDLTLARFLVARPVSMAEAAEMFRSAMEWRASRGVGRLFVEFHPAVFQKFMQCARREPSPGPRSNGQPHPGPDAQRSRVPHLARSRGKSIVWQRGSLTLRGSNERARFVHSVGYAGVGGMTRDGLPYFVERLGAADVSGVSGTPEGLSLLLDACAAPAARPKPHRAPPAHGSPTLRCRRSPSVEPPSAGTRHRRALFDARRALALSARPGSE